ncbi:MAG: glycosyltransferase family 2 protein [Chloroflexota bacterium]
MPVARAVAIIPAFNEAARVADVVRGALAHLPVIVVDDGSTDTTAVSAEAAGATVVRQQPNQGKGAALRAGFERAIAEGYDAAVTLDSDGQHDPAEIPSFLAAAAADPSLALIVGRRDFAAMPPMRRLANELGGRAFSWAVGRSIPDNQSGYRLLTRPLMEATLSSRERGFEFEVEMIAIAIRAGWGIGWVPIRTIYAGEASHIQPWRHFTSFIRVVRAARRAVREGPRA